MLRGRVVGVLQHETLKVVVARSAKHVRYGKRLTRSKTYLAYGFGVIPRVGEWVTLAACAPMSKRKRWRATC